MQERRLKEKTCRHCGRRYEFDIDNIMDDDEMIFCSPACANCANTQNEEFWAAPCFLHIGKAEIRNNKIINS